MTRIEEAQLERVCRRMHGEMSVAEAAEFDAELLRDARLAKLYRQMTAIDGSLTAMPMLKPSSTFTASVLRKTRPVVLPTPEKAGWLDWLYGLAPVAGLLAIALIWGPDLWGRATGELSEGAGWLDQTLGTQWFVHQPFILLGLLIPVAIGVVTYSVMMEGRRAEI